MPPPDVLSRIAHSTCRRVEALKAKSPVAALRALPLYDRVPGDMRRALSGLGPNVIAEIKFASPSEGALRPGPDAAAAAKIAGGYLAAGARALSILTEPEFFAGSPEYLKAAREAFPAAPILMKDFFLDPYQFELARAHGADAVLLIAALVEADLGPLLHKAQALGLSVLVEVHTEEELEAAQKVGASLLGVNSRDLKTLTTDLAVARRLSARADKDKALLVAESGIATRADIDGLAACGYSAFLVGTSLMRQDDPGRALSELLAR